MDILTELCSVPTAPFAEARVIDYVERFAARRRRLKLSRDRFGNRLLELPGSKRGGERWVFAAHMDHPGFVAEQMLDPRTLRAAFRGGVRAEYFMGSRVRFFDEAGETTGTVREIEVGKDRVYPERAIVRVARAVPAGSPGMWDQAVGRTRRNTFYSRVCDDLAGAAAALAMLDELLRTGTPPKSTIAVLLTRAEEDGFIGAMAAARQPKLLRKSDRIVAIECSAMQPYAPQGKGPIIRVGDRTSVFHSGLTYFLSQCAAELVKSDKHFQFQRALMPGGTCEASVYDAYGFAASCICIALGNYHNMDAARQRIAPEYIDLNDWRGMVKLFVHVARSAHTYEPGLAPFKQRIEDRFAKLQHLL